MIAQVVKNPSVMQEMQVTSVGSLGRKDLLEKEMATCSSILAWEMPWTEEPGGISPWGCKESDMTEHANMQHLCIDVFQKRKKKNSVIA